METRNKSITLSYENIAATLISSYQLNNEIEHRAVIIALRALVDNDNVYDEICKIAKFAQE